MSKKHEKGHKKEVVNEQEKITVVVQPKAPKQQLDWKKIVFSEKTLIVLMLILIIGLSTFFRMYPSSLHATEKWAEDTAANQVKSLVQQSVAQQFPNLPQAQRDAYVNEQLQEALKTQEESLRPQKEQLAAQFKAQLQDEHNNTYLLAIDPYIWFSYAKNYEANGHFGDAINEDGESVFTLRGGKNDYNARFHLHPYLTVKLYRIGHFFNHEFTLQRAAFLMPVFVIAFAIIAAFFLGRKIAGNVSGFVAGLIIALNTALLGRTPAGFSDTDAYLIFFPLLLSLLYIEALTSKTWKRRITFLGLSAITSVLFWQVWSRWWHVATILMGMTGIYFLYTAYQERKKLQKNITNLKTLFTKTRTGRIITTVVIFFAFLLIFTSLFSIGIGDEQNFFKPLKDIFLEPLGVLSVKSVATANIWPNVLTTVAELNEGSWRQIIGSVGGKLFFIIGILGVLLTFFLKTEDDNFEIRYASLLVLWFFGLSLVGVMSARFISLLAAPFAIAFGAFFGIAWTKGTKLLDKEIKFPEIATKIAIIIIILLLFITPVKAAHNVAISEIPSMDDGWHDSLTAIKQNSEDAIITSWWDFGHWFINIAERRVTFDGGDQGKRIYWVGKSLMTNDLQENKAILRMLNCGQNNGYELLEKDLLDSHGASKLINTIIYQSRDEAKQILIDAGVSATEEVLTQTHCSNDELIDQYFIVSQDMISKSNVWAHFGSWDFDRAYTYYLSKNNEYDEAVKKMQDELNLTEDEANKYYFEATSLETNREVDTWISPWPSYITTSARNCQEENETVTCSINQFIGQQQGQNIYIDKAIVPLNDPSAAELTIIVASNGVVSPADSIKPSAVNLPGETGFNQTKITDTTFPYEITVDTTANGQYKAIIAENLVARSAFTKLFFFDGKYMEGYEKLSDLTTFRGQRVIVYKVNLEE